MSQDKTANSAQPSLFPKPGTVLAGKYRLISPCSQGSTSLVYKAEHSIMMNREIALKLLRPELCHQPQSIQAVQGEARFASRCNHPSIVPVYDFGMTEAGQPFIVMDFIQGHSVADEIAHRQTLPADLVIQIFIQICSAVDHLSKQNIVHRSINANKIMFRRLDSGVKATLVGFSRAKEIGESTILSAAVMPETRFSLYMSPEHVQGKAIDSRADIYGIGCTMYQALTGEIPLKGPTVYQTIHRHLHETAPPLRIARADRGYPQELEFVVAKAMQKNPAERFQSASEMAASLQSISLESV